MWQPRRVMPQRSWDGRWKASDSGLRNRAEILRAIAVGLDKENTPESHAEAKRIRKRAREIEGRDSWRQRLGLDRKRKKEVGNGQGVAEQGVEAEGPTGE